MSTKPELLYCVPLSTDRVHISTKIEGHVKVATNVDTNETLQKF